MSSTGKFFVALIGLAALLGGIWFGSTLPNAHAPAAFTVVTEPRALDPFTLEKGDGTAWTQADASGSWTLLYFGFSYCPDICPATLQLVSEVVAELPEQQRGRLQVVFVSVDPERDRGARLDEYVGFFDTTFTGVTGEAAALEAFARDLGALFFVEEHEAGRVDYAVDHSGALFLLDPSARFAAIATPPLNAQAITRDLAAILDS